MSDIKHERGLHPLKGTVKTEDKNCKNHKDGKNKDNLKKQIQSSTDEASEIAGKIKSSEKK
ncbi:hypothetical protein [Polaribacter staleyi]|uniref:hypothetical protein n=1 Tax=Polaribacter staleyi TaxID=2022337 RepID=UPI0031BBCA4B